MTRVLRAYWWSPRQKVKLIVREGRRDPHAWARLALLTRRPFVNFGDEMTPMALSLASGRPVIWVPPVEAEVIAVGSILEYYAISSGRGGATVWGTGLRSDHHDALELGSVKAKLGPVLGVRGPLTKILLDLPETTPLGDPGLLSARLIGRHGQRRRGAGYIPHFRTWSSRAGRAEISRLRSRGVSVIAPANRVSTVLERIAGLDLLYSSSLHGLIAAHALGTPTQWVDIPGTTEADEPSFKFHDYLKSVGSSMNVLPTSAIGTAEAGVVLERRRSETTSLKDTAERLAESLVAAWRQG